MNYASVRFVQGRILQICSPLLLVPVIVAFFYQETVGALKSFGLVAVIVFLIASLMTWRRPKYLRLRPSEGLIITFFTWLIVTLAGALAFILSGEIKGFANAFFESVSGFTTTGSTILDDVESLSHYVVFWRSFSIFVGGMGILVFAFIFSSASADSVNIMKAEMPGPFFGKLEARLKSTASVLYLIYFVMTALTIILLMFGGMSFFDAMIHGFSAAGTGGFSNKNTSIGFYNSSFIKYLLAIAMFLFGVNFQVYYVALKRGIKQAFKNEELRWYLGIYIVISLLVFFNIAGGYDSLSLAFEESVFTVSSIMTTTGLSSADFALWPLFSQVLLLLLMLIGGSAGSTAGGLKVSRVVVYLKSARQELKKTRDPRQMSAVRMDGEILSDYALKSVLRYLCLYCLFTVTGILLLSFDSPDLMTAVSATFSTLNNVGPGLGTIGPSSSFSAFNDFSKIVMSLLMLGGRLELIPLLLFFSPKTWRRTS